MERIPCPQCGAEVPFISKSSVYAVCRYCTSTIVRTAMDVRLLGSMAALQEDPTVFQIGTTGTYGNDSFELIGRVQRRWSGGMWNEWHMYFGGGQSGWLAEAQGFLMISFLSLTAAPDEALMKLGQRFQLEGNAFTVHDTKEILSSYAEGELPVVAESGSSVRSVDLTGPGTRFACATYWEGGSELYLGEYVEFDDLQFKRIRDLSGW